MIENKRYPHVKRGWIKAIKAIRNGGVFKREYIWWNIRKDWMPLRNVRGLLRTQADTSIIQTQNTGWSIGSPNINPILTKRTFGERYKNDKWKTKQRDMEARGKRGFHPAPLLTA